MRPAGAGAVMADHGPLEVAGECGLRALHRRLEFFPTPPWAARVGGELIQRLDPGPWWAWEPACGQGHMAWGLKDYFPQVLATDIHAHSDFQHGEPLDFLSPQADRFDQADWIITNPPFRPAGDFVRAGLRRARRGVAIFARSGWLETLGRFDLFYGEDQALAVEAPFFERVPIKLGEWDPDGSTATPYSWFLFFRPDKAPAWLEQLRGAIGGRASVTLPIPPGQRRALSRPEDLKRFRVSA